jgi:hypothetical protein
MQCRFDAVTLLQRLRNKRLAFVGDSLNRNQWISMVCLIDTATPTLHKSMAGGNSSLVSFRIHVRLPDHGDHQCSLRHRKFLCRVCA